MSRSLCVFILSIATLTTSCGDGKSTSSIKGSGDASGEAGGVSGSGGAGGHSTPSDAWVDARANDATRPDSSPDNAASIDAPSTQPSDANTGVALVNPAPGSRFFAGANFWRIDWEGTDDFFVSNIDWTKVTNPWQPQLLLDLAPYKVLRFMDWNLANSDPNPQGVWSTRTKKTQSQDAEPIAFEWQIDLCNRAQKDCWFSVPIQADATYEKSLAQLIYQLLDPGLRVYVEYSNEVWNEAFPQAAIALENANRLDLPATPNSCCDTDTIKIGNAYVYGAVRLFEQFESVFGNGSPRLVKVLSGQAGRDGVCQVHMLALKNKTLNPNSTMPTVYAIAPYFGGTSIAELKADIADSAKMTSAHVACVAQLKLPLVSYEGGSDSFAASSGCTRLQHDSGMLDLYKAYYDAHSAAGMTGPFNQYTHVGECWGLKEKTSDSLSDSPKYQGMLDWLAAHP